VDYDGVKDLQQLGGVPSLQDSMEACARFTWQSRPDFMGVPELDGGARIGWGVPESEGVPLLELVS